MRDLSAALTQLTVRLDQIEHEYGARLDKLSERVDQDSSSRFADIAARLDKLEKTAALPATPVSESADVVARLDKLEKRVRRRGCAGLRNCWSHDKAQQVGEESRRRGRKFGQSPPACRAETIVACGEGGTFRPE